MKPKATETDVQIAKWLSAALEDPIVCNEMKNDINSWMESKDWSNEESQPGQLVINWEKTSKDRPNER